MGRLSPGEFLIELDKLFSSTKDKGSVYVVMKRTNLRSRRWNKKHPEEQARAAHLSGFETLNQEAVCLVRAYDSKKKKFSTQVSLKEAEGKFAQQLMLTLRANMDGLKKRAKVKGKTKASTEPA